LQEQDAPFLGEVGIWIRDTISDAYCPTITAAGMRFIRWKYMAVNYKRNEETLKQIQKERTWDKISKYENNSFLHVGIIQRDSLHKLLNYYQLHELGTEDDL
jgi:hypothetical protein